MQPRSTDPNEEPAFDWAKAFSGFQRNLFKMFVYGDPLVDETIKKWESEKGTKTKQNQDTKRQQSTNGKQRANNNRQQTFSLGFHEKAGRIEKCLKKATPLHIVSGTETNKTGINKPESLQAITEKK